MRLRQQWLAFILGILACPLSAQPSRAEGAMAIGIPRGGAAIGFASGHKVNARNLDEASKLAVDNCKRSNPDVVLKATCKIVATFRDKCLAIAIDPKDGTPGAGWAIAETQVLADQQALVQCRATAGAGRQDACVIPSGGGPQGLGEGSNRGCDGKAK